jgi:Zn finger protein HypA/HybF involved in hydrogenase expression
MALMGNKLKCIECGHEYFPVRSGFGEWSGCPQCKARADKLAEEKHFAELDNLSLEERLRRVEKWIYHYKVPVNPRDIFY